MPCIRRCPTVPANHCVHEASSCETGVSKVIVVGVGAALTVYTESQFVVGVQRLPIAIPSGTVDSVIVGLPSVAVTPESFWVGTDRAIQSGNPEAMVVPDVVFQES